MEDRGEATAAQLEELPRDRPQAACLLLHLILLHPNPIMAFKSEAGGGKLHIRTHRLECSFPGNDQRGFTATGSRVKPTSTHSLSFTLAGGRTLLISIVSALPRC